MTELLGDAVLELSTDGRMLDRGLSHAERSRDAFVKRSAHAMRGVGTAMSVGFTVPMAFAAREAADEMNAIEAASNNSERAIARQGKGALIAVKGVESLAAAWQQKSGIDDQVIQSGENMLLNLGAIDVTTKLGVKTFKTATGAMVNFAEATGTDAASAGKLFAKTMAAASEGTLTLPRGVKLGEKAMTELETAFDAAGSAGERQALVAEALGQKFAGAANLTNADKWNVMIDTLKGVGAAILESVMPIVTSFAPVVEKLAQKFGALSPNTKKWIAGLMLLAVAAGPVIGAIGAMLTVGQALVAVLGLLFTPIGAVVAILGLLAVAWLRQPGSMDKVRAAFAQLQAVAQVVMAWIANVGWPMLQLAAAKVMAFLQGSVLPQVVSVMQALMQTIRVVLTRVKSFWDQHGAAIMSIVRRVFGIVRTIITTTVTVIAGVIKAILAVIRGDWGAAWEALKGALGAAVSGLVSILKQAGPLLLEAAILIGKLVVKGVVAGLKLLGKGMVAAAKGAVNGLKSLGGWALDQAKGIGKAIVDGIIAGIKAGAGAIKDAATDAAKGALDGAKSFLHIKSPSRVMAEQVGLPIAQGVALGIDWGSEEAADRMAAMGEKLTARGQAMAEKAKKTKSKVDDRKAAKVLKQGAAMTKRANAARAQADKRQLAIDRVGAVADLGQAFVDLRIARQGGPSVADLQEKMRLGDTERAGLEAQLKQVDKKGKSVLTVQQRTAIMQRLGQIANDAANLTDQIADLQSPLNALATASSAFNLAAAQAEYRLAESGGTSVDALNTLLGVAKQQKDAIMATLQQPGLDPDQQTSLWQQMTQLVGTIAGYQDQIAELSNSANGGTGPAPAGTTAGAVTRLPGQVAGDAGGTPVIGQMNVTVTDPDVDVPQLTRRINWHAQQVGAY